MNYQETLDYLYHLGNEVLSADYRLGRIERVLEELDWPQTAFPSVIVAGTNGKGSVSAMVEAILRASGLRTGMYTSPHLNSICERIRIEGREIPPEAFAEHAGRVHEAASRLLARSVISSMPTFFEHVTAAAFCAFREQLLDVVILEVGLGGRLDATNSAPAFLALISQIDFDHEKTLGSTLAEIAREKASVVKACTREAVIAPQRSEVAEVIRGHCRGVHLTPRFVLDDPAMVSIDMVEQDGRVTFSYRGIDNAYEGIRLGLRGYHQVENAVVAIEGAEALRRCGFPVPREAVVDGLQTVEWPGRLEFLTQWTGGSLDSQNIDIEPAFQLPGPAHLSVGALYTGQPPILLDGAHNPAGARALRSFLDQFGRAPITLVFGAMRDKRIEDMASILFPAAAQVLMTRVTDDRAADLDYLGRLSLIYPNASVADTVEAALRRAMAVTPPTGMICVAGSLYLVGAIRQLWHSAGVKPSALSL